MTSPAVVPGPREAEPATVELRFSALPAHVRTARLVAAAVARRSGVDETVLDEVRLAVGEACSRAVDLHQRHCPTEPVRVTLTDGGGAFRVSVADRAPTAAAHVDPLEALTVPDGGEEPDADALASVGIAVISGLVDHVSVDPGADGTSVSMTWPLGPSAG